MANVTPNLKKMDDFLNSAIGKLTTSIITNTKVSYIESHIPVKKF